MKITQTGIEGLLIIEPAVFGDTRGYFFESFNESEYLRAGIKEKFVQDNESLSQKNVLRGLHLQLPPYAQAKLVRVNRGAVLDVAVDVRKNSPTYGKYFATELSATNKRMMYIPEGFAHGFLTLEDNTIFIYKCSNFYHKDSEACIRWNDPAIGIEWNVKDPVLSQKDTNGVLLKDFKPVS